MPDNVNAQELYPSANPNVKFKLGLQSAIDNYLSAQINNDVASSHPEWVGQAEHGTFYLTQDTHRLYVGNYDHTFSAVNQGVIVVSSTDDLPPLTGQSNTQHLPYQGQFYYVADPANILCVASGTHWVQINPDTYVDQFSKSLQAYTQQGLADWISDQPSGSANRDVKEMVKYEQTLKNSNQVTGITHTLQISSTSSNLHVATDGVNTIRLSCEAGDVYHLSTTDYPNSTSPTGVKVDVQNSSNTSVGYFIITGASSNTLIPQLFTDQGETFIKITGGVGDYSFTLVPVTDSNTNEQTGELRLTLIDSNRNASSYLRVNPTITIGDNSDVVNHFDTTVDDNTGLVSLNTTLDVYTTGEVDRLIERASNTANAMYFAGVIDSQNTMDNTFGSSNVGNYSNGATFKIGTDSLVLPSGVTIQGLGGNSLVTGDLVILQGQEYQNEDSTAVNYTSNSALVGKLVPSTVTYQYVPSGDDNDMYHILTGFGREANDTSNSVTFTESTGGLQASQDILAFDTNTSSVINITNTNGVDSQHSNIATKTIHIDHKTLTPSSTSTNNINQNVSGSQIDYSPTFNVISSITTDGYGHISGFDLNTVNIYAPDIDSIVTSATNTTGGVTMTDAIKLTSGSPVQGTSRTLTSSTLSITALNSTQQNPTNANGSVVVDLVWGQFA